MDDKSLCPICEKQALTATEHSFDIKDILDKWEASTQFHFSDPVRDFYNGRQTTLCHCSNCDFAIYRPALVGNSEFYSDITNTENDYYNKNKWEFRKAIKDIKSVRATKILDVGCGSGYFLENLRHNLPEVQAWGYEISPDLAQIARQKGFEIFTDDFPKQLLETDKESFYDVICVFQVLEHVQDAMDILHHVKKLLKLDGKVIIAVPDIDGPVGKFFKFSHMNMPPHHVSFWNRSVIEHAAEQIGMSVESFHNEPLPDYLYSSYLRLILEDILRWEFLKSISRKLHFFGAVLKLLNLLNIREIYGVQGHSVYAVLVNRAN